MKVIALYGPHGSGKSKVAMHVAEKICDEHNVNARVLSFADPIYHMLSVLEPSLRGSLSKRNEADKDIPRERLGGKSIREALVSLGSKWGRGEMSESFWAAHAAHAINQFFGTCGENAVVILDDLRFNNERDMLSDFDTSFYRLKPQCPPRGLETLQHKYLSNLQTAMYQDWQDWDLGATVSNNFTEDALSSISDYLISNTGLV